MGVSRNNGSRSLAERADEILGFPELCPNYGHEKYLNTANQSVIFPGLTTSLFKARAIGS